MKNSMELKLKATAQNIAFARDVAGAFIIPLNPSLDEISDIKTAVSEAVTNVVAHAYPDIVGSFVMKIIIKGNIVNISVIDNGVGIQDIEKALTPFYTTKPDEERSGMGFTVMESFMDKLEVKNNKDGLTVNMVKAIATEEV